MGLMDLHFKLKKLRLRRFVGGEKINKKRSESSASFGRRGSWMTPAVSHGYDFIVDNVNVVHTSLSPFGQKNYDQDHDSIVVQREQIDDEQELWFFGVFDPRIADGVTKFMQTHLFDKNLNEAQIRKKSNEIMRKAHVCARTKVMKEKEKKDDEKLELGSASAIVINGEKLVIANMGDYRAVVCRDGQAHQINTKHQRSTLTHWSHTFKFIPGFFRLPRVQFKNGESGNEADGIIKAHSKTSEIATALEKIDSDTEFVILASSGIWEVMKHQEAVNLIRHIDDPQKAAECLTKEAMVRMSRSNIACLIIRFD